MTEDGMWSIYFVTWVTIQLLIPVALVVAARRNRVRRPRAARWAFFVAILQVANVGVTLLAMFLTASAPIYRNKDVSDLLADPETWTFILIRWIYAILPAAVMLITTYVILEQPDRPRVMRAEESAS
jgi:glucan phosphoethanolaminetransferase (alkaline phosphatase superfamily)